MKLIFSLLSSGQSKYTCKSRITLDCTIFRERVVQETYVMMWSSKPQAHHEKHGQFSLLSFCYLLIYTCSFEKLEKCD